MKLLQLVLLRSIIVLATYHAVVMSMNTRFSQLDNQTSPHQNNTECPSVWFEYNQPIHDCQCIGSLFLNCEGEVAYSDTRHILTYDSNVGVISAIKMRHKYLEGYNLTVTKDGSYGILLPNNISELNPYMCGPLNRQNYLCSDCKSGYGPATISISASCANECYFCECTWYNILLYIFLNFIPLTVFYLLILVFQVRLYSAPMTCFIMYSQLVVLAFYEECGLEPVDSVSVLSQIKFTDSGTTLRTGSKILLTIYGVFNLYFFQYVLPPFCISSQLRPIHVFSLGYISAFYPFLLILLTWLCVELHGRNFRPIVYLWRPFHGCFVRLRRGWNTKSDLIDVFASLFLLSYSKILYQIILTFDSEEVINYSLIDGRKSHASVFRADLSIITKNDSSNPFVIFMMCLAVLLALLFVIGPVFLLFFYPTKILRSLLSKCLSSRLLIFLNTFLEKFHRCYRDGLDGTKDMRSFSGIYFLLRIIIYFAGIISRATLNLDKYLTRGFVLSAASLLIALSRPYKRPYMNIVDSILLSHMATLCYIIASTSTLNHKSPIFLPLMHVMIALPFIIKSLLTICKMTHGFFIKYFQWSSFVTECLTCLKTIRTKFYGSFNSQNLILPEITYGAIN